MKKILTVGLLSALFVLFTNTDATAQRRKTKEENTEEKEEKQEKETTRTTSTRRPDNKKKKTDDYFDEKGGFKHRLWYGGNFILNYSGANGQSAFTIGATPMVGYKIIGGLSAGPRMGIIYTNLKAYDTQNRITTVGLTDYSLGAFTRFKVFKNFFLHAEHEYLSSTFYSEDQFGRVQLGVDGKPVKDRQGRQNSNVGVGYNSGGLIGYEVALMYNLNPPQNTIQQPFDIRIGFTYNF